MALSSDLISQFVKVTNDETEVKGETIVYGTIVEEDDTKYVMIDGSNLLTPVIFLAEAKSGDRVVVRIAGHSATVTGNLTSPSISSGSTIDTAREVHNSGIDITPEKVRLYSSNEIVAEINNEQTMLLNQEGLLAPRVTVTEEFNAPNVVLVNTMSEPAFKGSIQSMINALPKYLAVDTTIRIPAGTYTENVKIRGFYGGYLRLLFSKGAHLNGYLDVKNCSHVIVRADALGDASIYPRSTSGDSTVRFYAVTRAQVSNMQISGYRGRTSTSDGSDIALYFNSSHALVENCCLEYANKGLSCNYSVVYAEDCIGGTNDTSPTSNANLNQGVLASSGSHVHLVGSYPCGGKADYSTYRGKIETYDIDSAGTPGGLEYVAPTTFTQTFECDHHRKYIINTSDASNGTTIAQGRVGTYTAGLTGWQIGAIWFTEATELAGKTINKIELTIRRASGGWNKAETVYLCKLPRTWAGSITDVSPISEISTPKAVGTLTKEQELTIDITSYASAITSGHAMCFYEPRGSYNSSQAYSDNYMNIYAAGSNYVPTITVTYS